MIDHHACHSSARRRTTTPTTAWVAALALPILLKKPNIGAKELQTELQDTWKCTICYDTVWRGIQQALLELHGTWEDSFRLLYNWKEAVLEKMPDSVIEIDTSPEDGKVYFKRFFCAFGPSIKGFLQGCRPYLSVDSTALNGRWNGHLPSACGVDGHNWMFPVAFGFFDSESDENWIWFMTQLRKAIGDLPLLAVCSDANKSLLKAVKLVFPNAEQRECFRHLVQNYLKYHPGAQHLFPAARAYIPEVFEKHYGNVTCVPGVTLWFKNHHPMLWYRSGFNPAIKCDYITNNIAEVFNNWIKDFKDLPVCDLADKIRVKLMELYHRRRRIGDKLEGKILPSVLAVLHARTRGLGHLSVTQGDQFDAEVIDHTDCITRHIVKASNLYCSCEEWMHTGQPCQHGLAVIIGQQHRNIKMEDFVHIYYSVKKFRKAYAGRIEQLRDKRFWPEVKDAKEMFAPIGKRGVGRQRKNRFKGCLEGGSSSKKSAENVKEKDRKLLRGKVKCPNCGELGHRKSSPKCPLNGSKKRKRKPRKNTTKGWFPRGEVDVATSSQQAVALSPTREVDAGPSEPPADLSPPREASRLVVRKITPRKKNKTASAII